MKTTRTSIKRRHSQLRPLHHRLVLHPVSLLLFLCTGVLLAGLTWHSSADSYTVNAQVLAPPLSQPAVITQLANQSHFTSRPIVVNGTCPEKSYVQLSRNGILAGTAICGPGVTPFQIQVDLGLGSNVLTVQDYNVTGQAGPSSTSITVYYANPAQPASPTTPSSPAGSGPVSPAHLINPSMAPFFITATYHYQPHFIYQPFNLMVALNGGTPPYALTIAWGDGSHSTIVRSNQAEFSAPHTYNSVEHNQQTNLVKLEAVDNSGTTAYLEVAELVCRHTCAAAPGVTDTSNSLITCAKQWVWLIWPPDLVVLVMVLSFWLGERQEDYNLLHKRRPRRA